MFVPYPISLLQFALFWAIVAAGAVAMFRAVRGRGKDDGPRSSGGRSRIGIALQGVAFGATGIGAMRMTLPWNSPSSLICSALVLLFGGGAVAVFAAATRAMGKNWSVVARTRSDHELVRTGPFAIVRHPIYLALLLYLLSFGIAFGHFRQLLVGIPFYIAGAIVRIRVEEKLLRAQFGEAHARYVSDVPAFIPFIR